MYHFHHDYALSTPSASNLFMATLLGAVALNEGIDYLLERYDPFHRLITYCSRLSSTEYALPRSPLEARFRHYNTGDDELMFNGEGNENDHH